MLGIPKDKLHELPEVHYPGRVILIDSAARAKDAVKYLLKQKQIGFDTETRPSFQKNHRYKVSLVQLSVPGECFLFRLKQIGSLDGLMSIFENPDIQKIGLSLKDDFHSLGKLCEFTPAGFVELQTFVKRYEIADNSLQKIYALIFGQRISKNQRLTNWEAPELTLGQQQYAAIDAWACVEIYNHLIAGKFDPSLCPYSIDDETAIMLQSSVGIHTPILHSSQVLPDQENINLTPRTYGPTLRKKPTSAEDSQPEDAEVQQPNGGEQLPSGGVQQPKGGVQQPNGGKAPSPSPAKKGKKSAAKKEPKSSKPSKEKQQSKGKISPEVTEGAGAPPLHTKTAESPKTPKSPKAPKSPKVSKSSKSPKTPKAPKAPKSPKTSKASKAPKSPKTPKKKTDEKES